MNIYEFIKNNGTVTVPNPEYNKKTKAGRRQPITVSIPDTQYKPSAAQQLVNTDLANQWSVDKKTSDKYAQYGLNYNPREFYSQDARLNLDNQLADAQGIGDKLWNASTQAIYSQLILGTLRGFGDIVGGLASIPEAFSQGVSDSDYGNWFSDYLEKKQQDFDENHQIYTRNDESPFSAASLISHIPTIATIASMAFTTKGFMGAAGSIAKETKLTSLPTKFRQSKLIGAVDKESNTLKKLEDMNAFARGLNNPTNVARANAAVTNTLSGIVNTAMWNYSSAHGVYNQVYNDLTNSFNNITDDEYQKIVDNAQEILTNPDGSQIDTSDKNAVARRIASASADRAYAFDWLNSAFMIPQYYALRNVGRNLKNADTNYFIRQAERERIKDTERLFMSDAEKKAADAALTKWDRIKPQIADILKSSPKMIGSQTLGALQMGVVDIGSQEGISYGKSLIDGKYDVGFTDRFNSYMLSPELWEEMAWGAVAGTAFHLIGSGLKTAASIHTGKKIAEKEAAKQTTEEGKQKVREFYATGNIANATRKVAMQSTLSDFKSFIKDSKRINDGYNPLDAYQEVYKENGKEKTRIAYHKLPEGDEERTQEVKDAIETSFITKSALRAARNGNLKIDMNFMASDAVRKVMVDQKVVGSEQEAIELQQKILNKMHEVDAEYDKQLFNVTAQIQAINRDNRVNRKKDGKSALFDEEIPVQYAAVIATDNTMAIMNKRAIDTAIGRIEKDTDDRIQSWIDNGKLAPENDYKAFYNYNVLRTKLGQLYAERKQLLKENDKSGLAQIRLGEIEKDIKVIEESIGLNNEELTGNDISKLLYIIGSAKGFEYKGKDSEGNPQFDFNAASVADSFNGFFKKTDDKLVGDLEGIGKVIGRNDLKEKIDPTDMYESWTKFIDRMDEQSPKGGPYDSVRTGIKDISSLDPKLDEDLMELSKLKLQRDTLGNQVYATRDEVARKAAEMDTELNESKRDMINQAVFTVMSINEAHNKDGKNPINMGDFIHRYNNGESIDEFEGLTDSDKTRLKAALDVLDLTNVNNGEIELGLRRKLSFANMLFDRIRSQKDKDDTDKKDRQEKTTGNKNQSESTETDQSNSNTKTEENGNGGQPSKPQPQQQLGETSKSSNNSSETPQYDVNTATRKTIDLNYSDDGIHADKHEEGDATATNTAVLRETETKGLYEIVGLNGQPLNSEFYSNTDLYQIDTLPKDGGVPIQNPLVRIDDEGKLIIEQTGKVDDINKYDNVENRSDVDEVNSSSPIKEDTKGEIKEGSDTLSTGGENQTADDSFVNDDKPTDADKAAAHKSAFDVSEKKSKKKPTSASDYNVEPDEGGEATAKKYDVIRNAISIARDIHKDTPGGITDDGYKLIRSRLESIYGDDDTAKENIDIAINHIKNRSNRKKNEAKAKQRELIDKVTDEAIGRKSTITEEQRNKEINKQGFTNAFAKLVDDMLDQYHEDVGGGTIGDKKIINPENLYRYANSMSDDATQARIMHDMMMQYLRSKQGKDKYIIKSDVSFDRALVNAEMSESERMKILTKVDNDFRLNLNQVVDSYEQKHDDVLNKKVQNVIQGLKNGESLELNVNSDGRIVFTSQGITLGDLPVPNVDKAHGFYYMENKGVITDVKIDANGNVVSKLYDKIHDWIYDNTKDGAQLRQILESYSFTRDEKARTKLLDAFNNNPIIVDEIHAKDSVFHTTKENRFVSKAAVEYLSNIYTYHMVDMGMNRQQIADAKMAIIKSWFEKQYKEYTIASQISKHPTRYRSNISYISDGEVIRANETVDEFGHSHPDQKAKMTPANKALGILLKGQGKMGVMGISATDTGIMHVAKGQDISAPFFGGGHTFMVLPNRNGDMEFVQAYPISATDFEALKGTKADEILNEIYHQVDKAFNELGTFKGRTGEEIFKELYDTLYSLYGAGKNKNPGETKIDNLLGGFQVLEDVDGFSIFIPKTNFSIDLKYLDKQGNENPVILVKDNNKTAKYSLSRSITGYSMDVDAAKEDVKNFIKNHTKFTININHLISDNNTHSNLHGAATRKDGKFVVKVGDKEWEFENYNDYAINNNIVRVNTKSEDGITNFRRRGARNVRGNQQLNVRIRERNPKDKSNQGKPYNPVDEFKRIEQEESDVRDKVMKALAGNNSTATYNTGRKIANILFGGNITDKYSKKMPKGFALFPKNLIFDEQFNTIEDYGEVNAETNTNDIPIKIGNRIVMPGQTIFGTKLMSMIVNQEDRPQAIRKLIHEQLHQIIHYTDEKGGHPNEKYVKQVKEAFDLFVNANKNDKITDNNILSYEFNNTDYRDGSGNITADGLEEFLVEAMTSKTLARRLDEIKVENTKVEKPKSLLQKIMDIVYNLLGFDKLKDDTLRTKLFNDLRDAERKIERKANRTRKVKNKVKEQDLFSEAEFLDSKNAPKTPPVDKDSEKPDVTKKGDSDSPLSQPNEDNNNNSNDKDNTENSKKEVISNPLAEFDFSTVKKKKSKFQGFHRSTITENNDEYNNGNSSSADSQAKQLPFNERAKFNDMVERGEISIIC